MRMWKLFFLLPLLTLTLMSRSAKAEYGYYDSGYGGMINTGNYNLGSWGSDMYNLGSYSGYGYGGGYGG